MSLPPVANSFAPEIVPAPDLRHAVLFYTYRRYVYTLDVGTGEIASLMLPGPPPDQGGAPPPEGMNAAAWSPDGRRLAFGGVQGTIHLLGHPDGGAGPVARVVRGAVIGDGAWSPDGSAVAVRDPSGGAARVYRFPPARDEAPADTPVGEGYRVPTAVVRLSPDGRRLASALSSGEVAVWAMPGDAPPKIVGGHPQVVNSTDYPFGHGNPEFATGTPAPAPATQLLWAPGGKLLASYRGTDAGIKVYDVAAGREVFATYAVHPPTVPRALSRAVVWCWDADGKRLAVGVSVPAKGGEVPLALTVWDVAAGRLDRTLRLEDVRIPLAWSPDGKLFASPGRLWGATTGELVGGLQATRQALDLAWSPDGTRLGWAGGAGVSEVIGAGVYGLKDRKVVPLQAVPGAPPVGGGRLVWSPDGKRVAVKGNEATVFDAATGERLQERVLLGDVTDLAWGPDGLLGARGPDRSSRVGPVAPYVAADGKIERVALWAGGRQAEGAVESRFEFGAPYPRPCPVAWSPDGKLFAVVGAEKGSDPPRRRVRLFDGRTGTPVRDLDVERFNPLSVAWTPDGKTLLVAGSGRIVSWEFGKADGGGLVKDVATAVVPARSVPGRLAGFWSADRKRLAVVAAPALPNDPGYRQPDKPQPVAALSPDGRLVAGGGNPMRVWDVATGEEKFRLLGQAGTVEAIHWLPAGRRIITQSTERRGPEVLRYEVRVWDADTGREVIDVVGPAARLRFDPALKALYRTDGADMPREVVFWTIPQGTP